jgi:hypothetical protein
MPDLESISPTPTGLWTFTTTSQCVYFVGSGGYFGADTAQKIGFYGKASLAQQNSIAAVDISVGTDGLCTAINLLIARMGSLGLISMSS